MARSEARLAVSIWSDPDFLALSATAQRLFMFLLSQEDLAHDGVIALRERRWSRKAAGLTATQVADDLSELEKARFVVVDDEAEELLIRSFIRRDKVYRQPNVLRAAADHLKGVTSVSILREVTAELDRVASGGDVPAPSTGILAEMRAGLRSKLESPVPKGSANPSRKGTENPSPGTPGERGVVTAVTTASPSPVPRASDPRPQPSAGGRADARDEPPERCPDHAQDPDPPNCGRCAGARKAHVRWQIADSERIRKAAKCRSHRGQLADNCALCRSEALGDDS